MDINNPFGNQFVQSDSSLNKASVSTDDIIPNKLSSTSQTSNSRNTNSLIVTSKPLSGNSKITQDPNKTQIQTNVQQTDSIGQIVGIVVLVVFLLLLAGVIGFIFYKHRK